MEFVDACVVGRVAACADGWAAATAGAWDGVVMSAAVMGDVLDPHCWTAIGCVNHAVHQNVVLDVINSVVVASDQGKFLHLEVFIWLKFLSYD